MAASRRLSCEEVARCLNIGDGCVVIPRAIENQVLKAAYDKLKGESNTKDALMAGLKLSEVFAEFGVL